MVETVAHARALARIIEQKMIPAPMPGELRAFALGGDVAPDVVARYAREIDVFVARPVAATLARWAESVRAVVVYTRRSSAEDYANEVRRDEDVTVDVTYVDEGRDDHGTWVYPGEENYPADPSCFEQSGNDDGGVWVPASSVDVAALVLSGAAGSVNRFYAVEASVDPFQPGAWYSAEVYEHPHGDEVTEQTAHLYGFTPEEETVIYAAVFPNRVASPVAG